MRNEPQLLAAVEILVFLVVPIIGLGVDQALARGACQRYLGQLMLCDIDGDVIWSITQAELKRGNKPATVNRYLSVIRNLLRTARDEWQWIDRVPKLEWDQVDLERANAWLDRTKNGTLRGVPLNRDAIAVLKAERGKHPVFCFTFRGEPIGWEVTNTAWRAAIMKAGITGFRFHDLRHTWASWHRQAGTSCDELKELGGWKSRVMVDRYAKFGTEHLAAAAARIERRGDKNVVDLAHFCHTRDNQRVNASS